MQTKVSPSLCGSKQNTSLRITLEFEKSEPEAIHATHSQAPICYSLLVTREHTIPVKHLTPLTTPIQRPVVGKPWNAKDLLPVPILGLCLLPTFPTYLGNTSQLKQVVQSWHSWECEGICQTHRIQKSREASRGPLYTKKEQVSCENNSWLMESQKWHEPKARQESEGQQRFSLDYTRLLKTQELLSCDVEFPSVCYKFVLLPLVGKEAAWAYGRAE